MESLLGRIKIPAKIVSVLLLLGLASLAAALVATSALSTIDANYSQLTNSKLPATVKLVRANRYVAMMIYAGYRTLAYDGNSAEARAAAAESAKAYENAQANFAEVATLDPDAATKVAELRTALEAIHGSVADAVAAGLRNDDAAAKALLADADKRIQDMTSNLLAYNQSRVDATNARSDELSTAAITAQRTVLGFNAVAILGALALGWAVARYGITRPIDRLMAAMRALAEGRLAVEVPGAERGDELGAMARTVLVFRDNAQAQTREREAQAQAEAEQRAVVDTLDANLRRLAAGDLTSTITADFGAAYQTVKTNYNAAVGALRELIGAVLTGAAAIRTGAQEIAVASEDLARRTESNAASLEQTSAAIAQMEGRAKATAEAANESATGSTQAMTAVNEGRSCTDQAVQAMARVSDSAKGIDNVIEGLDKIAFQTRVLAMNAAVEAGRAGDAGRGFAVVADLVSALAMRAEEEAKAARDQLTVTQEEIGNAVGAVGRVDTALAGIASAGSNARTLTAQMAQDNDAQSSAITEIATAVGAMDQATQQNAAMVEQTSAAARSLNAEIGALVEQAARFTLDAPGAAAPGRTPARAPVAARAPQATPAPARRREPVHADGWASF